MQGVPAHGARLAVGDYLNGRLGVKKAGVYAVIDEAGVYQFVGYARSIHNALKVQDVQKQFYGLHIVVIGGRDKRPLWGL